MRKKRITAEELMAQLERDPAYVKRQAELADAHELREAEIALAMRPLLQRLAEQGYEVSDLRELVLRHAPLAPKVVDTLLEWLPKIEDGAIKEHIVRALGAAGAPFPGESLAELFDRSTSEGLRWAIANTIAEARPGGITDWVLERARDPATGKAREMLALAVARLAPPEVANAALLRMLDDLPGHVALALAEIGGPYEATVLEAKSAATRGWVKREIEAAIRAIRRRSRGR